MAAKSEPGIYLGQDRVHNAPAVMLLRTGKRVITKDVRFINDRFAHLRAYSDSQEEVDAVLDGDIGLGVSEQSPVLDKVQSQGW